MNPDHVKPVWSISYRDYLRMKKEAELQDLKKAVYGPRGSRWV